MTSYQTFSTYRPARVAEVGSAQDVRAAVRQAVAEGLPVAVRATGHGLPPYGRSGVLVDTSGLRGLTVDPVARLARAEAGVRWAEVVAAAAPHGLAPLSGSAPRVGVVGYTLGGGLSVLGRTFGWAADRVRAVEVVTADGELRRTGPGEELFTALLGGGVGLGVVTAMTFELVEVPELWGGRLVFPDAAAVLPAWVAWTRSLPESLTSAFVVLPTPGPRHAHVRVAQVGPGGADLVAPLRALGPVGDTLRPLPLTEVGSIADDPTEPAPFSSSHRLLRAVDEVAVRRILAHLPAGPQVLELRHLGGALAKPGGNAVPAREAAYLVGLTTIAPTPESLAARDALLEALAPWADPRRLRTFETDPARARPSRAVLDLRARLDPERVFGQE
ncbi:FAD/FMN-containing dehydrogenase [Crossiella equi]|uniref:FAD/FMN-containing dehydrogenase n=1 Tax=Crossiella equi TaxID=130796 RepID=A0ABS5AD54_9PSEU|nr:FAD-binding oxidoreductase [Crossiella equi]MBP2474506.1 FAD/FMN-containing dehydrogenase [Crossiella equi]